MHTDLDTIYIYSLYNFVQVVHRLTLV